MAQGVAQTVSAYLDTHVAVWLHDGLIERLSSAAKRQIEASDLLISPMALLELQYLYDRKRVGLEPIRILDYLSSTFGAGLCHFPFPAIALEALALDWTSDPFDRIIVAHAKANGDSPLITADTQIRRRYHQAVW